MKTCKICKLKKSLTTFGKQKSCKDGFRTVCKECRKIESKLWYKANAVKLSEYYSAKYLQQPSKYNIRSKAWKIANKAKRAEHKAKRRALELQAMPKYVDRNKIRQFYRLAQVMTMLSCYKYHVDHIIPLQGKNVCGFHLETNLQVIRADLNLIKGSKHE